MSRPRLLDLFGGEGLAALGYAEAGFDVVSVENDPERIGNHVKHPRITVVDADATTFPLDGFDAVHGSPPCTDRSTLRNAAESRRGGATGTAWMLPHTIARFREHHARTGVPWVVENVPGTRRSLPGAFKLCGTMFDLTDGGWWLERHRWFACSEPIQTGLACRCRDGRPIIGVYGDLSAHDRRCSGRKLGREKGDMRAGVERARRLMQAPWASARGLALGIPPAYTRFIGEQLLAHLPAAVAS